MPSGARMQITEAVIDELERLYAVERAGFRVAAMLVQAGTSGPFPMATHPDVQALYRKGRIADPE
jgi:hypothetical protein